MIKCKGCEKAPKDVEHYVKHAEEVNENMKVGFSVSPEEAVIALEPTYNRKDQTFLCPDCFDKYQPSLQERLETIRNDAQQGAFDKEDILAFCQAVEDELFLEETLRDKVQAFIGRYDITCGEAIYQSDMVSENATYLVEELCTAVDPSIGEYAEED